MKKKFNRNNLAAPQIITIGFATVIILGALLLMLPISSQTGEITSFIDAIFTATSATCVTGLTTLNTAEHWSLFGQVVILIMIELGGLGFMSIPIFFYIVSKRKVNLSTRMLLREAMNFDRTSGEVNLMWYVIKTAFVIQFLGFILLAVRFVPQFGMGEGLWYSLFHSVSSFCNAGFDLFGDSLASFQQDPWVLSVVMFLVISGGLGFLVWYDVLHFKKGRRMTLHSRIALWVTGSLLVGGFVLFFITEQNSGALVEGDFVSRTFNTMFMAVTPRTAGYASIDYLHMSHAGLIVTMVLMFIGGTSGSTAGGLKTTTFGVLVIKIKSIFKGRSRAEFGDRTIREASVSRALTLFFITLSLCIVGTFILCITETIPAGSNVGMEYIAFEVVSAFGTVGISMGLTPSLTLIGKLVIIALMFIGRVGIMTVAFSMVVKGKKEAKIKYPDESVMIG